MVHQSVRQSQGTHEVASFSHSFSSNISGESVPQQPFSLPASRVETIKLGLSRKGYSVSSIEFIIGAERPSTRKQYQSTWKNFLNYLAAQSIDHSNISRPVVLDFLHFYSTEFHRKYRTVAGYKCALYCPLLWTCDLDLEDLLITAKFMRGAFNFNPPQKAKVMPKWSFKCFIVVFKK